MKKLITLLSIPLIVGALNSCEYNKNLNKEYRFNGEIKGNKVRFKSSCLWGNILKVERIDGTYLKYKSMDDFELDWVYVHKKGDKEGILYSKFNPFWEKGISEEAQKQFDEYLDTIKAINYDKALESIKE